MPISPAKRTRTTLLRYWTKRYVITLTVGLLIIGTVSVLWLRYQALHQRLQQIQSFAADTAEYVGGETGIIVIPDDFYKWIDNHQRRKRLPAQFGVTVFDANGRTLFYKGVPKRPGEPVPESEPAFPAPPPLESRVSVKRAGSFYTITTPIFAGNEVIGTIAIAYGKKELTIINQQYGLIGSLLLLSGLLGWLILYWLLRQMSKPIHRVVQAFKQIEAGDYKLMLEDNAKEQEIYELLVYFNAMAVRLEQLEQLRAELLAGVTHELRTPITSIRGLTRAVRDQVVASDEAEEFLDLSLKETKRLERLVADLLHFNAYASGSIRLQLEDIDLGKHLGEIVSQWRLSHQDEGLFIETVLPDEEAMAHGDADRIQQIIVNLLNNSRQSMLRAGRISIIVQLYSNTHYELLVKDTGSGIPADEQINIFERHYRGTNKKREERGLGLGLTLCRMLASAMNGRLSLKESSPEGTTFQLLLPKASKIS
ncbi:HAMP domain-containing sensor histidine kinase [Paenibacillus sp. MMS18-CY102]|uniref:HAMP domain-containing sensor histidine kinase n=1 Tax=Paenibacillus sp. MMS18-CY102 TaxID=2682849 RepID=UPI0013663A5D|nr:HAMP domain-containing sensor histidine kinase [Paenibacillus sp. MMS18-CY102]MWC29582.1 HAMP domain-containing protein [Paenibacillus sp. MMS18-CY102]